MSIGHSPWPGGLIATKRDQSFDSLESQLHNMLQHIGETSTEYINNFLQGAFDKENVVIERRSFMRYLRSDERFTFHGTTRSRTIMAAKEKVIDGWGKVAEKIVEMMLAETLEKGVDFTISHAKLRAGVGIKNSKQGDISFARAIDTLCWQRRIGGAQDSKGNLTYSWGPGCFLGFSPGAKKSSGVSLPPRTWEVAKQLTQKINQAKKEEFTKRIRSAIPSTGIELDTLLSLDSTHPKHQSAISDNSVIQVALNRPGSLNTSEIFELAIELLKANLNFVTSD
jgi:hypothetical protein